MSRLLAAASVAALLVAAPPAHAWTLSGLWSGFTSFFSGSMGSGSSSDRIAADKAKIDRDYRQGRISEREYERRTRANAARIRSDHARATLGTSNNPTSSGQR